MRVLRVVIMLVALGAALSCQNYGGASGGGGVITGPPGGGGGGVGVRVGDNNYIPATVTVSTGETITWTWQGSNAHSVTFNNGPASATQISGTFQTSFPTAGTYTYYCVVHGSTAMSGSVIVQ